MQISQWDDLVTYWNGLDEPIQMIIIFFIYLILLIVTLRINRFLIGRYGKKLTETTSSTFQTLSRMIIILIFGVAFLNQFESFSGSLIGLSALLGTAIGFASTQTVGNLISGLYIMVSRPFFIGDYVIFPKLGPLQGIVREITLNYTKIIMPNGTSAIISNKTVLGTEVVNTRVELEESEFEEVQKYSKRDGEESETFENVKKELFSAFKSLSSSKKSIFYVYPITFSVDVNLKQKLVNEAVNKLEKFLENDLGVKDMNWRVVARNRLEVTYEANIMVDNSYSIFGIVSNALNKLEIFLEDVKE